MALGNQGWRGGIGSPKAGVDPTQSRSIGAVQGLNDSIECRDCLECAIPKESEGRLGMPGEG